ncbi:hypothetical protein HFD88_005278 [Aspergillus terreus]|nr:hypothetical protein HFD88_005278 [Aspergillus terreus]
MSAPASPFQVLSDDNRGPLITLVSVSFLIAAIIFVAAKVGSVIYFKQQQAAVNTPIWVALVLSIVEVVVMQKAVDRGVGRHADTLTTAALSTANKFTYVAQLLSIIVLALSKLSTTLLVWKLTPKRAIRTACKITIGLATAWAVFGLFAIAFQCQMPEPWVYTPEKCVGEGVLLYPVYALHIITEIIVVVIPFFMMRHVQLAWKKRVKILASFSARICVVGMGIAHLSLLPPSLRSSDTTWDIVHPAMINQAMMSTTVAIACMPTLYHIFAGLHSGLITTRLPDEVELSHPKSSGYINQSTVMGSKTGEVVREKKRGSFYADISRFGNVGSSVVTDITTSRHKNAMSRRSSGSESTGSRRHLTQDTTQDGVLKTVNIKVEVERDSHPSWLQSR